VSFLDVYDALIGGVEIDNGVIEATGEAWEGDGGDLMVDGDGEGLLFTGTRWDVVVELVEGEIAGVAVWDGRVEIDDGVTAGAKAIWVRVVTVGVIVGDV